MSYDSDQVCVDNPCDVNVVAECLSLKTVDIDTTDSPYAPDKAVAIIATADTGIITINLTADADCPNTTYIIKRTIASAFNVVVVPPAGELIDSAASYTLLANGDWVQVIRNTEIAPVNWEVLSSSSATSLIAKGDLLSHNGTTNTILPVGTSGQFLSVDPVEATGLKWVTTATNSVAYHAISIEISATTTTWTTMAYFAWDDSRYSAYSNGAIVFWAQIGGAKTLGVRVIDSSSTVLGSLTGINSSGIYNISLPTLPTADDYLRIEVSRSAGGGTNPRMYSTQFEFTA